VGMSIFGISSTEFLYRSFNDQVTTYSTNVYKLCMSP
jgi:hypothetical protein